MNSKLWSSADSNRPEADIHRILNSRLYYLYLPGSFVVRSIAENDFDQWKILWDDHNQFYGRSGSEALSPEITRATWSRLLEVSEPVNALVAEGPARLLGLAYFIYHRTTIQIGASCYMQDLFANSEARGQGVDSALIHEVYKRESANGSSRVYWQTHEFDFAAMKLYDKVAEKSRLSFMEKRLTSSSESRFGPKAVTEITSKWPLSAHLDWQQMSYKSKCSAR